MNNLAPSALGDAGALAGAGGDVHWWFTALDQRSVAIGAERWLTQVVGVHIDGFDVWIQIELVADQIRSFVIRVSERMSLDDVLTEIERRGRATR